jgi:hypothetical protein
MINLISVFDQMNHMAFTVEKGNTYHKIHWNKPYAPILQTIQKKVTKNTNKIASELTRERYRERERELPKNANKICS